MKSDKSQNVECKHSWHGQISGGADGDGVDAGAPK